MGLVDHPTQHPDCRVLGGAEGGGAYLKHPQGKCLQAALALSSTKPCL